MNYITISWLKSHGNPHQTTTFHGEFPMLYSPQTQKNVGLSTERHGPVLGSAFPRCLRCLGFSREKRLWNGWNLEMRKLNGAFEWRNHRKNIGNMGKSSIDMEIWMGHISYKWNCLWNIIKRRFSSWPSCLPKGGGNRVLPRPQLSFRQWLVSWYRWTFTTFFMENQHQSKFNSIFLMWRAYMYIMLYCLILCYVGQGWGWLSTHIYQANQSNKEDYSTLFAV